MTKTTRNILTILGTVVLMGIMFISGLLSLDATNDQISEQKSIIMVTLAVGGLVSVIFSALISKLFIFLAQLGQEVKQSVSFMNYWYATVVSMLPFAVINAFLVIVLNLYKDTNKIASIVSSVISTLLYVLIVRQDSTISKRTQIIYIVISLVLSIGMSLAF